jgi:diadenosine tetraphosphate (Ap4A) HIT family hydrolase
VDFDQLKIKEYEHWSIFLNENQCYLGRVALVAKRKDAVDFIEMTLAEREEFFLVGSGVNCALKELFQPDLMNYASLGNSYRHLHVHFIPRYATKRIFHGMEFTDSRWGKNYEPYDRSFKTNENVLLKIISAIQDTLKAF